MEHTHAKQPTTAPQLQVHREDEEAGAALNWEEERERRQQQSAAEEYWAGRNHAMRQSARVAA